MISVDPHGNRPAFILRLPATADAAAERAARQNSKRATSCPVRGWASTVDVLMAPNPDTSCSPGAQVPLPPLGSLQVGAVSGLMPMPLIAGLFRYVRLNTLFNSARTLKLIRSLMRNWRPKPRFSTGRRSPRKSGSYAGPPNWPGPGFVHAFGFNTMVVFGSKQWQLRSSRYSGCPGTRTWFWVVWKVRFGMVAKARPGP